MVCLEHYKMIYRNVSFITLIPKVENPQELNAYKPISLMPTVYKIMVKIIFNRLRKVIHKIIDKK